MPIRCVGGGGGSYLLGDFLSIVFQFPYSQFDYIQLTLLILFILSVFIK